jgi:sporulation integral membrane protein YlbJ
MSIRKYTISAAFFSIALLILDSTTAFSGAAEGLELCIRTVIPSLFPFFILSIGLVGSWTGLSIAPLRLLGKILHIPSGVESILIPGFLGGYPVGAQAIAECYHRNQITADTAERLSAFCNNAGPAFIFGIVSQFFPGMKYCWILWGVHIVSAVLVAAILPKTKRSEPSAMSVKTLTLSEIMNRALRATATVCGWIIIFRVILAFLDRWILWRFSTIVQAAIYGILELSNGCCMLTSISSPELRFVLSSGMLAWGGLCVTLQTRSVTEGLSIKAYLKGKFLQTVFSVLLSASVVLKIWLPTTALLVFLSLLIQKTQNRCRNPAAIGV